MNKRRWTWGSESRESVSRAVPRCSGIGSVLFKEQCDWTWSLHLYLYGTALLAGSECGRETLILTNTIYCVLYSYLLFQLKPQGIRLFCSCSVPRLVSSLDSADPQLRCLDRIVFSWVLCLFPLPRKVTGGSPCMQRALTQDGIHRDGPTYVLPAAVQLMVAFKPSILCPLCLPCSTTRVPSLRLFFQASLRISTHLHIRSDPPFGWFLLLYRLKSDTFPGTWLAKSGAQCVSTLSLNAETTRLPTAEKASLDLDGLKTWLVLLVFFFLLFCSESLAFGTAL